MSYHFMTFYNMSCQGMPFSVMSWSGHINHVRRLIHDTITRPVAEYEQMKRYMSCHIIVFCDIMPFHITIYPIT